MTRLSTSQPLSIGDLGGGGELSRRATRGAMTASQGLGKFDDTPLSQETCRIMLFPSPESWTPST